MTLVCLHGCSDGHVCACLKCTDAQSYLAGKHGLAAPLETGKVGFLVNMSKHLARAFHVEKIRDLCSIACSLARSEECCCAVPSMVNDCTHDRFFAWFIKHIKVANMLRVFSPILPCQANQAMAVVCSCEGFSVHTGKIALQH